MFGRTTLYCSFCGKDETQVAKLVAGPKVHICDVCVETARQIMEGSGGGVEHETKVLLPRWRRLLAGARRLLQMPPVSHRIELKLDTVLPAGGTHARGP